MITKNKDFYLCMAFVIVVGIVLGSSLWLVNWQVEKRKRIIGQCLTLIKRTPDTRNARACRMFFNYCIKSNIPLKECKKDSLNCLNGKRYE